MLIPNVLYPHKSLFFIHHFLLFLLFLILHFSNKAHALTPSLFCKCMCGTNYTIISLSEPPAPPPPNNFLALRSPFSPSIDLLPRHGNDKGQPSQPAVPAKPTDPAPLPPTTGTCSDCTRHLCYVYQLPVCVEQKYKEEDIVATCFQRDSQKDRVVVCLFVASTVGLLVYAVLQPWVGSWINAWKERQSQRYTILPGG